MSEIKLFTGGHEQYRESAYELRMAEDGEQRFVEGRGIVFNQWTELIPGRIRERISRSALEGEALSNDICCFSNHNKEKLLGRTGNQTMTIQVRDDGAYYRTEIPPTTYGEDLKINLSRGAMFGSSFVFTPNSDGMTIARNEDDGVIEITHNTFTRIKSIDPVFSPAYKQTSAMMRHLEADLTEIEKAILDHDSKTYKSIARARYEMWNINLNY